MRPFPIEFSRDAIRTNVTAWSSLPAVLPALLLCLSVFLQLHAPITQTLLVGSVSWAALLIRSSLVVGFASITEQSRRRKLCWTAGGLFALAQVCDRASLDREGNWATKALLPCFILGISQVDLGPPSLKAPGHVGEEAGNTFAPGGKRLLIIAIVAAAVALNSPFVTASTYALGFCSVLVTAVAFLLLESASRLPNTDRYGALSQPATPNGSHTRRMSGASSQCPSLWLCIRDFALAAHLALLAATFTFNDFTLGGIAWDTWHDNPSWKQPHWIALIFNIIAAIVHNQVLMRFISEHGAFRTGLVLLGAFILARLLGNDWDAWRFWFSVLCLAAGIAVFNDLGPGLPAPSLTQSKRIYLRQLLTLLLVVSLILLSLKDVILGKPSNTSTKYINRLPGEHDRPTEPLKLTPGDLHPIDRLIENANSEFEYTFRSQSKTLKEAVAEYRRRYGIPPPPNFDRWYAFAKKKNVQLIDEYDSIHHSFLPFWALEPKKIRNRVAEAFGFEDNAFIGVLIRDGKVTKVENGAEWQQQATSAMLAPFIQSLPDMDLAFNIHDEPRVIVPHDVLSRMVEISLSERMPPSFENKRPRNSFSSRPADMNSGKSIEEVWTTRFNRYAHQPTWSASRVSCPSDSPARNFDETASDNRTAYALSDLGFVYNVSAFTDICNSPSLRSRFGFFDRPNAFSITQDLIPIFSQSKISSYQDILYPSPWYWFKKVAYDQDKDMKWEEKADQLYWRGSTTGGFSRNGGWRRQHRQHVVERLNAMGEASILQNDGSSDSPVWTTKNVARQAYRDLIDVKFSHIGQCDPADCDAQKEYFEIAPTAGQQDAWNYKHLLDMDGNGFSGRFYAFLQSQSLVHKMALFQEWHMDWLKPWVHYVPFSLRGDEWLEAIRYFGNDEKGKQQAPSMAEEGRNWARKVLRPEDFEVWFFRLLLEYGRLIDDDREVIGFDV